MEAVSVQRSSTGEIPRVKTGHNELLGKYALAMEQDPASEIDVDDGGIEELIQKSPSEAIDLLRQMAKTNNPLVHGSIVLHIHKLLMPPVGELKVTLKVRQRQQALWFWEEVLSGAYQPADSLLSYDAQEAFYNHRHIIAEHLRTKEYRKLRRLVDDQAFELPPAYARPHTKLSEHIRDRVQEARDSRIAKSAILNT